MLTQAEYSPEGKTHQVDYQCRLWGAPGLWGNISGLRPCTLRLRWHVLNEPATEIIRIGFLVCNSHCPHTVTVHLCLPFSETGNRYCPVLDHKCCHSHHELQTTGRVKQKTQMKDNIGVVISDD